MMLTAMGRHDQKGCASVVGFGVPQRAESSLRAGFGREKGDLCISLS